MTRNHKEEFITVFDSISKKTRRFDVYKDFIKLSTIAFVNAFDKIESIEKNFEAIKNKYTDEDYANFKKLFAIILDALSIKEHDFLGEVFMDLNFGESSKKQFFTPFCVSEVMAKITFDANIGSLKRKGYITLSEPTCGTGGMVIAFCKAMKDAKFNYQQQLFVQCVDLDPIVAMSCYIQLSMLGVPAEVVIGDSLTNEFRKKMYTPFYVLGKWDEILRMDNLLQMVKRVDNNEVIKSESDVEVNVTETKVSITETKSKDDNNLQINLL